MKLGIENSIVLCEFDVDFFGRWIGNHPERILREHESRARKRRHRIDQRVCLIDDRHLYRRAILHAAPRGGRAEAPHQVLPPTGRAVVPDALARRCKQVVRGELARAAPETSSCCIQMLFLWMGANVFGTV